MYILLCIQNNSVSENFIIYCSIRGNHSKKLWRVNILHECKLCSRSRASVKFSSYLIENEIGGHYNELSIVNTKHERKLRAGHE
jgi:hypothetical protein